jgi:cbb3-type cytochrome oxidase subunit 3
MKNFKDISLGILIVFIILFLIEIMYFYKQNNKMEKIEYEKQFIEKYDLDNDGIITKEEIRKVIEEEAKKNKNSPIKLNVLYKSWLMGTLRGCMTGILIGGLEGALTGGLVLGIINPLIVVFDHYI